MTLSFTDRTLAGPTTWDLGAIFPGGPAGEAFRASRHTLEASLQALRAQVEALPAVADDPDAWAAALLAATELSEDIGTLMPFASCSYAAHTNDEATRVAREQIVRIVDASDAVRVGLVAGLDEASDEVFEALVARPDLVDERAMLVHDRRRRPLRLPRSEQSLLAALRPHALGGWGSLYSEISGSLTAEVELPGKGRVRRSAGQLQGLLANPDPAVREAANEAAQQAWSQAAPLCARAIEHITGARAAINEHRGVDELADTCARNRIERSTLDALWAASDHARPRLQAYLDRKAAMSGVPALAFWDLHAPLPGAGAGEAVSWASACRWIVEAFERFDPGMAEFAVRALDSRWIEAEDRAHKRPGGFCTRLARRSESRIFMTWSGTMRSVYTLAHELGHAWHNEMLFRQPAAQRRITSATAETASTFAEALVRDHLLQQATDPAVRVAMLDEQAQSGVGLLLDIQARYLFERELYRMGQRGPLTPDALGAAMVEAQKQAFGEATLRGWNPTFWASKLHFYIAAFGFYNWPYAFGYLFSSAVYDRARQTGPSYAPTVRRLLSEMGYRWTEDVGERFLGADMGEPEFWIGATRPLLEAVDAFLAETTDRV